MTVPHSLPILKNAPSPLEAAQGRPQFIVVLYSSRFGQAMRIAQTMVQELEAQGHMARAEALGAQQEWPADCQALVLVASIRYGHFAPAVRGFVQRHARQLASVPSAFASVSLTARKPEKREPQNHSYTRKFLAQAMLLGWQPRWCAVLAGALRYPLYGWLDKQMIRLIMRLTGGETRPDKEVEYTDWQQVRAFARQIGAGVDAPVFRK